MSPKLLLLSNGHGEDAIALKIGLAWAELGGLTPTDCLAALPLVGTGNIYQNRQIPLMGPVQSLPSGGFNNMDARELWRDVRGGLIALTQAQLLSLKQWTNGGGKVLAVGDLVPLILAWLSQSQSAFVGTAKSEYYLRQPGGDWLPTTKPWEKWLGSAYYPWERWLMNRPNCVAVFPRDRLTQAKLQSQGVASYDVGNPMMDGLVIPPQPPKPLLTGESLTITLLPGSRSPEMERNWVLIIKSLESLMTIFPENKLIFLAAIAPSLSLLPVITELGQQQWQKVEQTEVNYLNDGQGFRKNDASLILTQRGFRQCLENSQAAIAMAGTATEQFVGMGKPVVSFPGLGPQYNAYFARRQTWLLGPSLTLLDSPQKAGSALKSILQDEQKLLAIAANGQARLGPPGAAQRIAEILWQKWG